MTDDDVMLGGGCLCGAVRFTAAGQPLWVAHCHCADCRRATAAALATYAGFPREKVRFPAGEPAGYQSSPGVTRRFCPDCGTQIYSTSVEEEDRILGLRVGTARQWAALVPRKQIWHRSSLDWVGNLDDIERVE